MHIPGMVCVFTPQSILSNLKINFYSLRVLQSTDSSHTALNISPEGCSKCTKARNFRDRDCSFCPYLTPLDLLATTIHCLACITHCSPSTVHCQRHKGTDREKWSILSLKWNGRSVLLWVKNRQEYKTWLWCATLDMVWNLQCLKTAQFKNKLIVTPQLHASQILSVTFHGLFSKWLI